MEDEKFLGVGSDTYNFDDLVTPEVAARVLCVSSKTIRNWAYQKKIDHYKISNRLRFCIRDLVDFSDECRVTTSA